MKTISTNNLLEIVNIYKTSKYWWLTSQDNIQHESINTAHNYFKICIMRYLSIIRCVTFKNHSKHLFSTLLIPFPQKSSLAI